MKWAFLVGGGGWFPPPEGEVARRVGGGVGSTEIGGVLVMGEVVASYPPGVRVGRPPPRLRRDSPLRGER